MSLSTDPSEIRELVKDRYGKAVEQLVPPGDPACCAPASCCGGGGKDPITRDLYSDSEAASLPAAAMAASLGCGNPTALADLRPGDTVLDLGSGGGIDVLLSAGRVGPTGFAYGLDMTPQMLAVARENQRRAGATNVEFLEGHIEAIPLPDASVDVIVSNCVINLSGDKDRVLREAYRVLKPGGRFAVSDVVLRKPLPPLLANVVALWTGCVAGALLDSEYQEKLTAAGFTAIDIGETRSYTRQDAQSLLDGLAPELRSVVTPLLDEVSGQVYSAFIRARKA